MNTEQNKKYIEKVRPIGWGQTSANPYIGAITACIDALRENGDTDIYRKHRTKPIPNTAISGWRV